VSIFNTRAPTLFLVRVIIIFKHVYWAFEGGTASMIKVPTTKTNFEDVDDDRWWRGPGRHELDTKVARSIIGLRAGSRDDVWFLSAWQEGRGWWMTALMMGSLGFSFSARYHPGSDGILCFCVVIVSGNLRLLIQIWKPKDSPSLEIFTYDVS